MVRGSQMDLAWSSILTPFSMVMSSMPRVRTLGLDRKVRYNSHKRDLWKVIVPFQPSQDIKPMLTILITTSVKLGTLYSPIQTHTLTRVTD